MAGLGVEAPGVPESSMVRSGLEGRCLQTGQHSLLGRLLVWCWFPSPVEVFRAQLCIQGSSPGLSTSCVLWPPKVSCQKVEGCLVDFVTQVEGLPLSPWASGQALPRLLWML